MNRLVSTLHSRYVWNPQQKMVAKCSKQSGPLIIRGTISQKENESHQAPNISCECGIWGLSNHEKLEQEWAAGYVRGTVALWGKIVVGAKGWRAQFAYPLSLIYIPQNEVSYYFSGMYGRPSRPIMERVAKEYRIPILDEWPELTRPDKL